jgi:hypothetical protein
METLDLTLETDLTDRSESDHLVILQTFSTVVEAYTAMTSLEAAGMECCIPEEYTPQLLWYMVPSPLERVTIRVAAKSYAAARDLLLAEANS